MKLYRAIILLFSLSIIITGITTAQDDNSNVLRIAANWTGAEAEGFNNVVALFTEETGIEVVYEPDNLLVENVVKSGFLEDPTHIAFLPRPGIIRQLAEDQELKRLDDPSDPIIDLDLLNNTLSPTFIQLGMNNTELYGLAVTSRSKSTIWYDIATFEEYGFSIPESWADLITISETLVADGITPFSVGGGDGWPLTDWFENIFVRLYGREAYGELFILRTIDWDDPRVIQTLATMSEMLLPYDERLASSQDSILSVSYRDSIRSWLEGDAPLYYEAGFVRSYAEEIFPDLICGEDYSFFTFPQIDLRYGKPIVGGSQLAVVFTDTPEAREFMNFIASPEAATAWVTTDVGAIISPNLGVDIEDYQNACAALEANQIRQANSFVFDGSDLMPGIFGEYAFFTSLQDYLINPLAVDEILEYLQFAALKSQ